MPTAARRICSRPGCPHTQPCPLHARRPWEGRTSARARGYDAEYERNRLIVLAEEDRCALCGGPGLANDQADHIIPVVKGGTSARANLRRAHRRCNLARARREGGP
jgi:5-methylcytosine-specific restriction endonuclease McrA